MVLYNAHHKPLWASGTDKVDEYFDKGELRMQNDGNLVLYHGDNRPAWCTRTDGGHKADHEYQHTG